MQFNFNIFSSLAEDRIITPCSYVSIAFIYIMMQTAFKFPGKFLH